MEELYFTYANAREITDAKAHLKDTSFTDPKSDIAYHIFNVMPTPADREDQSELRDLLADFIEKRTAATKQRLSEFESRLRNDKFTVMIWALGLTRPSVGLNLLSIGVRQFVDQSGQLQYGFQVHPDLTLF